MCSQVFLGLYMPNIHAFIPVVANNQDGLIIVNPTNQEESHGSCVSF